MVYPDTARRTFQEVHRDSKPIGTVEAELWRPTDKAAAADALEAARRYELIHKRRGRRNGPLGHVGLEVLNALWSVVDYSTGRLEPSLEWIMAACRRSRDAVVTALKRLAFCGFVRWIRRLEFTGEAGVRGPQVKQVTNAYALDTPADAAALVPSERRPRTVARAAAPDDYRLAIAQLAARSSVAAAASSRNYRQDHYRDPGDGRGLPKALRILHFFLAECESVTPDQSRPQNLLSDAPSGAGVGRSATKRQNERGEPRTHTQRRARAAGAEHQSPVMSGRFQRPGRSTASRVERWRNPWELSGVSSVDMAKPGATAMARRRGRR
jgi:hypothetical protein